MNYPNIKILREAFEKLVRYFWQNGYLNNGTTKYQVILLEKLAVFLSTKNKQINKKQKTKKKNGATWS